MGGGTLGGGAATMAAVMAGVATARTVTPTPALLSAVTNESEEAVAAIDAAVGESAVKPTKMMT